MEKEFEVYRGLQKPFTLFGLQGVNVVWAAVAFIGGMFAFAIAYMILNLWFALIAAAGVIGFCISRISYHLKYGLHNKNWMKGEWIITGLIKSTYSGKMGTKKK